MIWIDRSVAPAEWAYFFSIHSPQWVNGHAAFTQSRHLPRVDQSDITWLVKPAKK